ncbi:hypothetical protein Tco_0997202 [Tanacetum coccineum]
MSVANKPFKGTEGAVGLCQWFEKLESVFQISDCKERDKVKFTTATHPTTQEDRCIDWWNGKNLLPWVFKAANGTPWTEVRQWMTEEFCPRSVLQRLEQEIWSSIRGLSKNIRGDVTLSRPAGIDEVVRMAYMIMDNNTKT